jgi:DcuC family C4-dicarboxylate transporter
MTVMGYVGYMNSIKASDLFGIVCSSPLRKLKNPSVLVFATIVLTVIIKLAIPSSSSELTLLLATVFPVLLACGVSKPTAASALYFAIAYVWGPSNTLAYTAFNGAGMKDLNIPLYFAQSEPLPIAAGVIIGGLVFVFMQKFWDKKDGLTVDLAELPPEKNYKELGIPGFYTIFPLMPVIFVIIFSPIFVKSITLSVVAANFLSFIIVFICECIRHKQLQATIENTKSFWKDMGTAFFNVVAILTGINTFSAGLNAIGGLPILAKMFTNLGGSPIAIAVIACVVALILVTIGSSISGTLPLFSSIFAQFATSATELTNMTRMLIFSGGLGSALNFVQPSAMILVGATQVPITTVVKRTLVPTIVTMIVMIVVCILVPPAVVA